jgi:transcriptional regulator with XRE-family HTH domain
MVDIRQPPCYSFSVKLPKMAAPKRIDMTRIARLRRGGYTLAQIADDQGVTRNAIWKRLRDMEPLPRVDVVSSKDGITVEAEGVDYDVLAVAVTRALKRLGYEAEAKRA